jgi:ribosomal protein S18 acetylase RimI-like enzyme
MLAHGEQIAREAGSMGVSLYVEKHNTGPQEIYEHLGYVKTPYDIYEIDFVITRG